MTKAIAAGAHAVMIGGLFAGLAESPGEQILYQGRTFKVYRGMGSLGSDGQGFQRTVSAGGRAEDGTENWCLKVSKGACPSKGRSATFVYQLVGGLRAGMGYCGTRTIEELRTSAIHPGFGGERKRKPSS